MKVYLFHKDHPRGQIFDSSAVESAMAEGWVDSPAKLLAEVLGKDESEAESLVEKFRQAPDDLSDEALDELARDIGMRPRKTWFRKDFVTKIAARLATE